MPNATAPHCDVNYLDPKSTWTFCPSLPAAYAAAFLFLATLLAHIAQSILHKKLYSITVCLSALLQFGAYAFRVLSIKSPKSEFPAIAWFVLLLIAPLLVNAYIYQVFGRMIFNFTPDAQLARIKAWRFGLYFVGLDIFAFIIQFYGVVRAAGPRKPQDEVLKGIHIYMAGIGIQQLFVLAFTFMVAKFHLQLRAQQSSSAKKRATILVWVVYLTLIAITVRIIFRLVEYAKGFKSTIPEHEGYQYFLDSLPMFLAFLLLNVFHPGRMMPGEQSDFPPRSQRKNYQGKYSKDNILPGAGNMGTYVPMEGFSRSSSRSGSPENGAGNGPYRGNGYGQSVSQGNLAMGQQHPYRGQVPQQPYPGSAPYTNVRF